MSSWTQANQLSGTHDKSQCIIDNHNYSDMRIPLFGSNFPTPGICCEEEENNCYYFAPRCVCTMSRRKQAKPQHIHSDERQFPDVANGKRGESAGQFPTLIDGEKKKSSRGNGFEARSGGAACFCARVRGSFSHLLRGAPGFLDRDPEPKLSVSGPLFCFILISHDCGSRSESVYLYSSYVPHILSSFLHPAVLNRGSDKF